MIKDKIIKDEINNKLNYSIKDLNEKIDSGEDKENSFDSSSLRLNKFLFK